MADINPLMGQLAALAGNTPRRKIVQTLYDTSKRYLEGEQQRVEYEEIEALFRELVTASYMIMLKSTELTPEEMAVEVRKIEKAAKLLDNLKDDTE